MLRPAPDLEDEIRDLYQGPLGTFTARRDALAKRLRTEGDEREHEVRELRKPSVSGWGVSQLFAREPRAMAALVAAGVRARAGQSKTGGAKTVREALATIEKETRRLADRGIQLLREAGGSAPGPAIVERLRTNLEALALDPANAALAERRWLAEDLDPPGFEVLAGLQIAASGGGPAPQATAKRGQSELARAGPVPRQLDRDRSSAVAPAEREAKERPVLLEQLLGEVARLEERASEAAREAERAAKAAAAVEQRAVEARTAAADARKQAAIAEDAAKRAREALATAQRKGRRTKR